MNPEKEIGAVGEKRDVILWGNFGDFVLFRDDSRDTFFAVPRWTFIFSVTQSVSPVVQPFSLIVTWAECHLKKHSFKVYLVGTLVVAWVPMMLN